MLAINDISPEGPVPKGVSYPLAGAARDYERIGMALRAIEEAGAEQPDLAGLAAAVGLSPHHFQRLFRRWVGVSPKRFIQALTLKDAKARLAASESVLDAAFGAGLSGPSRLHDLFVTCEAMTPGEYKAHGRDLEIRYGFHPSPFGECLIMTTGRGVCGLGFVVGAGGAARRAAFDDLSGPWSLARFEEDDAATGAVAHRIFAPERAPDTPITLLLKGTNFQIQVWQALLRIPPGCVTTYEEIAKQAGRPKGARAAGSAIARNQISWIIPCHRVIRKSGAFNHYRWGPVRKRAMLGLEAVRFGPPDKSRAATPAP
jgi:AraC family transcriptional regulator of adaptative response/methylated-DNA-[protein]-cysteine methyltransferase